MIVDPATDESRLVQTSGSSDARVESKLFVVGLPEPAKLHHGGLGLPARRDARAQKHDSILAFQKSWSTILTSHVPHRVA